jgi:hypothetical protein
MRSRTVARSILVALGYGLIVSVIGLVGLPALFGALQDVGAIRGWLWLGCGVALCIWLLAPAAQLTPVLARIFDRMPNQARDPLPPGTLTFQVARLLTGGVYLIILQGIIRRPLLASVGAEAEPFLVEAVFAALTLLALLTILALVHQTARPLVEGLVRFALDTTLATTGSEAAAARTRAYDAPSQARSAATRLQPTPGSPGSSASEATQVAAAEIEETVASRTRPAADGRARA